MVLPQPYIFIACADTAAHSGEAESPPAQKAYPLRSRMAPRGTPGFGEYSTPEATAAAERAASVTAGPIKRRLKVLAMTELEPGLSSQLSGWLICELGQAANLLADACCGHVRRGVSRVQRAR